MKNPAIPPEGIIDQLAGGANPEANNLALAIFSLVVGIFVVGVSLLTLLISRFDNAVLTGLGQLFMGISLILVFAVNRAKTPRIRTRFFVARWLCLCASLTFLGLSFWQEGNDFFLKLDAALFAGLSVLLLVMLAVRRYRARAAK